MPGKISRVFLWIEVCKCVWKLDLKVLVLLPGEGSLATLPLHRVWADSIDRPQPHPIELGLLHHAFDVECEGLSLLDALHAKVKPRIVMAARLIRQRITRHVTVKCVHLAIFTWIASPEITRVKFTRNFDSTWQAECILLRITLINSYPVVKCKVTVAGLLILCYVVVRLFLLLQRIWLLSTTIIWRFGMHNSHRCRLTLSSYYILFLRIRFTNVTDRRLLLFFIDDSVI